MQEPKILRVRSLEMLLRQLLLQHLHGMLWQNRVPTNQLRGATETQQTKETVRRRRQQAPQVKTPTEPKTKVRNPKAVPLDNHQYARTRLLDQSVTTAADYYHRAG